ncbi:MULTISPECIES: S-layer homology domain-containing protein [Thermus]|uniref:S-layer homology domain-containing protein n=1 Tax=Thermus TaxID=270 RepID=UPI002279C06E|nr:MULTISPECIES: S-layer homology domain-containing protein [Thermus]
MKRIWVWVFWGLGLVLAAFSDLPAGPVAERVERVVQAGWMQGYPDGTFRGTEPVNRYQLVATLGRVLKDLGVEPKEVAFRDVPKGHWALEGLALAAAWDLVSGYPDGTFRGQEELNRAALAVVLAKMLERLGVAKEAPLPWDVPQDHWAVAAVRRVLGAGLMDLNPDGSFGLTTEVNRYQLALALAGLQPLVEAKKPAPFPPTPSVALQSPSLASQETLDVAARWVGAGGKKVVVLGERVLLWEAGGGQDLGPNEGFQAAIPPWRLKGGVLEDGKARYVPLGTKEGKEVLPPVFQRLREGHLSLDPMGAYLLIVPSTPLCDCPSRVVRFVLLLTNPVGLYAEYVYLLDQPGNRVVGVAWPDSKNLVVLEEEKTRTLLYRVNLAAGEDIALSVWDEGGLEERSPLPVRPVAKTLLAALPLVSVWGLGFEGPERLLTTREGKLVRVQLSTALW